MVDIVSWKVPLPPDGSATRLIHPESHITPDVGEIVSAAVKRDGNLGHYRVADRRFRMEEAGTPPQERDDTKVQAIIELAPLCDSNGCKREGWQWFERKNGRIEKRCNNHPLPDDQILEDYP